MQHYTSLDNVKLSHAWVTLGTFDGVHLGHQHIIRPLVSQAHQEEHPAVVVSFHPHPALVLSGETRPFYLTTPAQRAEILGQLGVDILITHPFNAQTANLSAEEFIAHLNTYLDIQQLWVGYDFAMGKNRAGTSPELRLLGKKYGYTLKRISPLYVDGKIISSSWIREALAKGEVERAAALLGRPHRVEGEVVKGDERGRKIGFPTSNLTIPPHMARLHSGVYACYVWVKGERRAAVSNLGVRPTFEDAPVPPRFETHILDFSGSLYGETLKVEFIAKLRDERKFENVAALQAQIEEDIGKARQILA
ncbi:MAG: Riboflavin biosynthesis protein RibF [Chloroflexi bacterium]|nr:Riboflavin biosynthesis protein RibF [Chloroflexota bacterium]